MASAVNGVRDGVATRCALLPGETLEDRHTLLATWVSTLQPMSPGEAMIVAMVADCMARLERVELAADRAREAGIEAELKRSIIYGKIAGLRDAAQGLQALAETTEGIQGVVAFEAVGTLAPAMKRVLELAEGSDAPMDLLVALREAMDGVIIGTFQDVGAGAFHALARQARQVAAWLDGAINAAEEELEAHRQRLAEDLTLVDEDLLRRVDRHRSRINRELEGNLKLLRLVREMARSEGDIPGSVVEVELRVVGKPTLALR